MQRVEKLGRARNLERNDFDIGPVWRQCGCCLAKAAEIALADVDDQDGEFRAGGRQGSQNLRDRVGSGLADADEIHAERQSLFSSDAVNAPTQSVELPLLQLTIHR